VAHIAKRELEIKAYTKWLAWFDDNCVDYFIKPPSLDQINLIRG
jgi:hypothetical protein